MPKFKPRQRKHRTDWLKALRNDAYVQHYITAVAVLRYSYPYDIDPSLMKTIIFADHKDRLCFIQYGDYKRIPDRGAKAVVRHGYVNPFHMETVNVFEKVLGSNSVMNEEVNRRCNLAMDLVYYKLWEYDKNVLTVKTRTMLRGIKTIEEMKEIGYHLSFRPYYLLPRWAEQGVSR